VTGERRLTIVVCSGPVCRDRRGSAELRAHLDATVAARGLGDRVRVADEVCLGHCLRGPNILVEDEPEAGNGVLYDRMTVADLDRVLERHLAGGMAIRVLTNRPPVRGR
jgi:(2Fe-2S) ferredoxin